MSHDPNRKPVGRCSLARIETLARLYRRLECLSKQVGPDPGEFLQLAAAFAQINAPCHVSKCKELYKEQVKA